MKYFHRKFRFLIVSLLSCTGILVFISFFFLLFNYTILETPRLCSLTYH